MQLCWTFNWNHKQFLIAFYRMTSEVLLTGEKNNGIGVYIPRVTILKEMAAIIR